MDILARIKQLVLHRDYVLTEKVQEELMIDDLTERDLVESILHADASKKRFDRGTHERATQSGSTSSKAGLSLEL